MAVMELLIWSEPSVLLGLPFHPFCLGTPTERWACFLEGPLVSDIGYVDVCECSDEQYRAVVAHVVLHARQGQNRHSTSYYVQPTVERTAVASCTSPAGTGRAGHGGSLHGHGDRGTFGP
jgi:hypothetical protein